MTDLNALVTSITAAHVELINAIRHTLTRAKALGELLTTAKKAFKKRGQFNEWVEANFPFTARTATNYMVVYRDWDRFDADDLANLTLPEFLSSVRKGKKTTTRKTGTRAKKIVPLDRVHEAARKYGVNGDVVGLLKEFGVKVETMALVA